MLNTKVQKRIKRHKKVRSTLSGTDTRPRISVFKSNIGMSVQVIDDITSKTLLAAKTDAKAKGTKVEKSKQLGIDLGKQILEKGIKEAVFDRGGNFYTGRVAAVAEGLREAGLKI